MKIELRDEDINSIFLALTGMIRVRRNVNGYYQDLIDTLENLSSQTKNNTKLEHDIVVDSRYILDTGYESMVYEEKTDHDIGEELEVRQYKSYKDMVDGHIELVKKWEIG